VGITGKTRFKPLFVTKGHRPKLRRGSKETGNYHQKGMLFANIVSTSGKDFLNANEEPIRVIYNMLTRIGRQTELRRNFAIDAGCLCVGGWQKKVEGRAEEADFLGGGCRPERGDYPSGEGDGGVGSLLQTGKKKRNNEKV